MSFDGCSQPAPPVNDFQPIDLPALRKAVKHHQSKFGDPAGLCSMLQELFDLVQESSLLVSVEMERRLRSAKEDDQAESVLPGMY